MRNSEYRCKLDFTKRKRVTDAFIAQRDSTNKFQGYFIVLTWDNTSESSLTWCKVTNHSYSLVNVIFLYRWFLSDFYKVYHFYYEK